jgi:hypothetical protein
MTICKQVSMALGVALRGGAGVMSDELFQTLLRELFQGHADNLRGLLQPLAAQQRKVRVFENLQRWVRFTGGDQGVARLMREVRQRHPEWSDALAPGLGLAMRRDGFFSRSLDGFNAAVILAGLEYISLLRVVD